MPLIPSKRAPLVNRTSVFCCLAIVLSMLGCEIHSASDSIPDVAANPVPQSRSPVRDSAPAPTPDQGAVKASIAKSAYQNGKQQFAVGDYAAARVSFTQAAELGYKPGSDEDAPATYLARMARQPDIKREDPASSGVGQPQRVLTDAEKEFLQASGSYLTTFFDHGMKVGTVMTGLRDKSTTLEDVKRTLRAALMAEAAKYEQCMLKFDRAVPPRFSDIHSDIVAAHRGFAKGMGKCLSAFDSTTPGADISEGEALIEAAARSGTRAVDSLRDELKKVKKQ